MEPQLNAIERAYKRLNTSTGVTITTGQWLGILSGVLVVAIPELTGIPATYGSPVTLFLFLSAVAIVRKQKNWKSAIAWNALGCFAFYSLLAFLDAKH